MTPLRALAIVACLAAARRRSTFVVVAAELGAEHASGELAEQIGHGAAAALAWAFPSGLATFTAWAMSRRSWRASGTAAAASMLGAALSSSTRQTQLLTCALSCACAFGALVTRTQPSDAARVSALLLLAGNVAGALLALALGVDSAYASGIVWTSNSVTQAAILGLAAWTATAR